MFKGVTTVKAVGPSSNLHTSAKNAMAQEFKHHITIWRSLFLAVFLKDISWFVLLLL
jgi:hypothetical protein